MTNLFTYFFLVAGIAWWGVVMFMLFAGSGLISEAYLMWC